MTQTSDSAAPANLLDVLDGASAPVEFEPALMIPWQSGLVPVTGLADRRWFLRALALADRHPGSVLINVGIIAIRLNGLRRVIDRDGRPAGDGFLLLTAEVLYDWSRGDDLAARLGPDSFAILAHTDGAGLSAAAARLRVKLAEAGVARVTGARHDPKPRQA